MELSMDASDFDEFGRFIDLWGHNIELHVTKNLVRNYEALGQEIASFIYSQIKPALGDSYGEFMATRTQITVTANPQGFHINIHGIPESQLPDSVRKDATPGKDDLWAAQEFGRYVSASNTGFGKQAINKDVGGITVIKKSRKGFEIKGKRGAIQALVGVLEPEIDLIVHDFMQRLAEGQILLAGDEARQVNKSKTIKGYSEFSRKLRAVGLNRATLLGQGITEIIPTSSGTLLGRTAGGQFASLGQHIKVQI